MWPDFPREEFLVWVPPRPDLLLPTKTLGQWISAGKSWPCCRQHPGAGPAHSRPRRCPRVFPLPAFPSRCIFRDHSAIAAAPGHWPPTHPPLWEILKLVVTRPGHSLRQDLLHCFYKLFHIFSGGGSLARHHVNSLSVIIILHSQGCHFTTMDPKGLYSQGGGQPHESLQAEATLCWVGGGGWSKNERKEGRGCGARYCLGR